MNFLIVGNVASLGWNLKQGLKKKGHDVDIVFDKSICVDGESTGIRKKSYDVVVLNSPNIFKLKRFWRQIFSCRKLVCYWHGSDLRMWKKSFPVRLYFMRRAHVNLYSTVDLAWWLPNDDRSKHLISCVDTDMFKPNGTVVLSDGARRKEKIPHKDMPSFLNRFECAEVCPAFGLDCGLLQVSHLEAISCGLTVVSHPYFDRDWVLENASIDVYADKFFKLLHEDESMRYDGV